MPTNYDRRRDLGCTVTWRDEHGVDRTVSEVGHTEPALERIVRRIDASHARWQVRCISTCRSIERDLSRPTAGKRRLVDPWEYERWLLTRMGRPELCPPTPRNLDLIPEKHRPLT